MKINNLSELIAEKLLLQEQAANISAAMVKDIDQMKRAIQPGVLLHKAISFVIPDSLKKSKITGVPISFILKALFNNNHPVSKPEPTQDKRNQIKNIAIGVLESAAMVFLAGKFNRRS